MNRISEEATLIFNNYPVVIKNHLYDLFNSIFNGVDMDNVESILFIGSGSRNELAYILDGDNVDIFSDYEFVIIVKKMLTKESLSKITKILKNLEKKWNIKSPLFHIDYGVATALKFRNTPKTLWAFEAKTLGVVVYGRDVRKDLGDISAFNIDYGNLNELIIVRLWNMLIYMNSGFINGTNNGWEDFIIKFYYSRNTLDILTILLPNYGVLKGGYVNRTNFFIKYFNNENWSNYKIIFQKVTDLKIDLKDEVSLQESQSVFYNGFINLISDISKIDIKEGADTLDTIEIECDNININKVFKEKSIRLARRKVIEFNLFRNYYNYSIEKLNLFINDKLRINLLLLLLLMHKSMDLSLKYNDKVCLLKRAFKYFNVISDKVYEYDSHDSFEGNFLSIRKSMLDFMMLWFYSRSNVTKADIEKHMNWNERR
jgi:hypothetical protein